MQASMQDMLGPKVQAFYGFNKKEWVIIVSRR